MSVKIDYRGVSWIISTPNLPEDTQHSYTLFSFSRLDNSICKVSFNYTTVWIKLREFSSHVTCEIYCEMLC